MFLIGFVKVQGRGLLILRLKTPAGASQDIELDPRQTTPVLNLTSMGEEVGRRSTAGIEHFSSSHYKIKRDDLPPKKAWEDDQFFSLRSFGSLAPSWPSHGVAYCSIILECTGNDHFHGRNTHLKWRFAAPRASFSHALNVRNIPFLEVSRFSFCKGSKSSQRRRLSTMSLTSFGTTETTLRVTRFLNVGKCSNAL